MGKRLLLSRNHKIRFYIDLISLYLNIRPDPKATMSYNDDNQRGGGFGDDSYGSSGRQGGLGDDNFGSSGRRQGGGLGDDAYGSGRTGDDNFGSGRGTGGFGGDDSFGSSGRTGGGLGMFPFQDLQGLAIV